MTYLASCLGKALIFIAGKSLGTVYILVSVALDLLRKQAFASSDTCISRQIDAEVAGLAFTVLTTAGLVWPLYALTVAGRITEAIVGRGAGFILVAFQHWFFNAFTKTVAAIGIVIFTGVTFRASFAS